MLWLRETLVAYRLPLALFHGQAFFVLSLSILFLARRSARLEIARGLMPLAVLGFCEALLAWFQFVPLSHWGSGLGGVRLLVLGIGYTAFLTFALQTCVSEKDSKVKRVLVGWLLPGGLGVLWLCGWAIAYGVGVPIEQVLLGGELTARYGLVAPGGLVGMWGLRRQTYRTIHRAQLSLVKPYLRVAGIGLGFWSLFGGLIGPAVPFFPGRWLNEEMILQVTSTPVSLYRGLCGLAITYGIVQALRAVLSEIDLWLESTERNQALARERERIGRELHDGIIQSIYAAGLMLEGARHSMLLEPRAAQAQLTRAIESLNQTIKDIRRYIFDLRGELPNDDLETGLRKILEDFQINTLLETEFVVDGEGLPTLGAERRQHIFQIAREALTNTARHARARRVGMSLRHDTHTLQLRISDDGIGLEALPINSKGQGLRNIRERARLLDGELDLSTAPNEGMTMTLTIPY
ncbi:MAG TPA: sensor histidine kinase [Chloroflexi bacterium]|nr:sensor histidine kinase [Chloroflexota bacterium]